MKAGEPTQRTNVRRVLTKNRLIAGFRLARISGAPRPAGQREFFAINIECLCPAKRSRRLCVPPQIDQDVGQGPPRGRPGTASPQYPVDLVERRLGPTRTPVGTCQIGAHRDIIRRGSDRLFQVLDRHGPFALREQCPSQPVQVDWVLRLMTVNEPQLLFGKCCSAYR
jgi:hypothetical protein